jgi:pyrroloquinoline quinone (PQQ) biosynthesis protein C
VNHPPFRPEDLSRSPRPAEELIASLAQERASRYPEPPGFYRDLVEGKADRSTVELWVKNHYPYWNDALWYSTGALFAKDNDEETRTHILRKLVCIEGKDVVNDLTGWVTPSYEELWLRLGEGLGISRAAITSWKMFTRSHYAMSTLKLLSRYWEWTWLDGIAAMYAGDLLGRDWMQMAYDGLRLHYGLTDEALAFFSAYLEDVQGDTPWEESALAYWACTTERQLTAARAFRNRLDIEYQIVLPLDRASAANRTGGAFPAQVP